MTADSASGALVGPPAATMVGTLVGVPAAALVGAMVAAAVLLAVRPRLHPLPTRVAALRPGPARPREVGGAHPLTRAVRVVGVVGGLARRAVLRPPDPGADAIVGTAVLAGLGLALVHPMIGVAAVGAVAARPWLRRRREAQRRARQVREAVPDLIDLFRFAAAGGLTVRLAVEAVAPRASGPLREALDEVRRRVALGDRLADAVGETLPRVGDDVRPLAAVLVHAERDGVALGPSLEHIADDARLERRRAAEEEARRLPVRLLFPLVGCILPAFVLLTIVPLLAGSFSSLPL
jgi:tight adherence protein C